MVVAEVVVRIQFDGLSSVLQCEIGLVKAVVVSAQVDVGSVELESLLVSDLDRLLVVFKSRGVVF